MKKAKSGKRGSAAKGKGGLKKAAPKASAPKTVDEYLARVPEPARSALNKIRAAIRSVVPPEATEIISYKMPAFRHKRVLVWYAAFFESLQSVPHRRCYRSVQGRTQGLLHNQRDHPLSYGQASAGCAD
jgi:hypothetical protein